MSRVEDLEERIADLTAAYDGLLDEYMDARERLRTLEDVVEDDGPRERTTATVHATVTETRRRHTPDGTTSDVGASSTDGGMDQPGAASQAAVDDAVQAVEGDGDDVEEAVSDTDDTDSAEATDDTSDADDIIVT